MTSPPPGTHSDAAESAPPSVSCVSLAMRACAAVGILAAGVAVLMGLSFFKPKPKPEEKPADALVKTLLGVVPSVGDTPLRVVGYGTAEAYDMVDVAAEVNGRVLEVHPDLKDGNVLPAGCLIVRLDATDNELALREARAEVRALAAEQAMALRNIESGRKSLETLARQLELQQKEFERNKSLSGLNAIPKAQYERVEREMQAAANMVIERENQIAQERIRVESLAARIEKAEATAARIERDVARAAIAAPITGRLANVKAEAGEYVRAGDVVARMADVRRLSIPVSLSLSEVAKILDFHPSPELGYQHWFKVPEGSSVTISWTEDPGRRQWPGRLLRVGEYNRKTRTLTVVVEPLPGAAAEPGAIPLVDGMFCRVAFQGRSVPASAEIPCGALQLDGGVAALQPDGTLRSHPVTVVAFQDSTAIVTGLAAGELLVAQQLPRGMVEGAKVRLIGLDGTPLPAPAPARSQ